MVILFIHRWIFSAETNLKPNSESPSGVIQPVSVALNSKSETPKLQVDGESDVLKLDQDFFKTFKLTYMKWIYLFHSNKNKTEFPFVFQITQKVQFTVFFSKKCILVHCLRYWKKLIKLKHTQLQ